MLWAELSLGSDRPAVGLWRYSIQVVSTPSLGPSSSSCKPKGAYVQDVCTVFDIVRETHQHGPEHLAST